MKRRVIVLAVGVTGVLMLGALAGSDASAASLYLKAEGTVAPVGTTAFVETDLHIYGSECDFGEYTGKLESNGKMTDKILNSRPVELNH